MCWKLNSSYDFLHIQIMQNAMISSIVQVTNLPRKRVVKWFEDKRNEDGIPDHRVPYQRSVLEVASSSWNDLYMCTVADDGTWGNFNTSENKLWKAIRFLKQSHFSPLNFATTLDWPRQPDSLLTFEIFIEYNIATRGSMLFT